MSKRPLLLLTALVLLQLPWLDRPVHYDEANFLTLARGAVADPWRPHDIRINWQGTEERAFDVLSNPPGIAWWLAPVLHRPITVQRAWMLPWLALALFGAFRLGKRFLGDAERGAMVLLTAPIVFLSTPALLPDAPLYALTLAGVGGFVHAVDRERRVWPWALLAGCAVLFRYSALPLAPLLGLYAMSRGRAPWLGAVALVPMGLLALHDLHAYGAVHLFEMGRFQSVANTPSDVFHKAVASVAMLGGAAALPIFPWTLAAGIGAVVGGAIGAPWGWAGALFAALGGAALGEVIGRAVRGGSERPAGGGAERGGTLRDGRWLAIWALGGFVFLLTLRFAATRYWLPFLPAVLLALPTARWTRALLAAQLGLGVLLAADDDRSALAQEQLADAVAKLGPGVFTGHWGWQWAMEQRGWTQLDEGARPALGTLVAMPRQAWPQPVEVNCTRVVWEGAARPPLPWIPRGYTEQGGANLHASWIQGQPPVRTVVPWTFANDPYERVRVCTD
ncbi:MAG: hypothetical protein Q8P18_12800 [Pseudomonadota bacterium]|nr:hypothetical protein [Pseudomonadota bacterium]